MAVDCAICEAPRRWRRRSTLSAETSPAVAPASGADSPLKFRQLGLGGYQLAHGDTSVFVVPMCRGLCRIAVPAETRSLGSEQVDAG